MDCLQCTKYKRNSAAGQWSCAKFELLGFSFPTLALPAVWMMLPFGLPAGQTFPHRSKLLACLSNHRDDEEEPPEEGRLVERSCGIVLMDENNVLGVGGGNTPLCFSACLIPCKDGFPVPECCRRLKAHQVSPLCSGTDGSFRASS